MMAAKAATTKAATTKAAVVATEASHASHVAAAKTSHMAAAETAMPSETTSAKTTAAVTASAAMAPGRLRQVAGEQRDERRQAGDFPQTHGKFLFLQTRVSPKSIVRGTYRGCTNLALM